MIGDKLTAHSERDLLEAIRSFSGRPDQLVGDADIKRLLERWR